MSHFTPVSATLGGMLIGLAAVLLWLTDGRIAGISGIVGNLATARSGDIAWRVSFLAGLVLGPMGFAVAVGRPFIQVDAPIASVFVGGVLVGFGTRLGSGCTSGHGVCGLARFSPRSLVATCVVMAAGFVTVFVLHHVVGI